MDFSGIEKLSLVDFDHRVSCILFTNGCNFRCPFCHNSDLVFSNNIIPIPFEEILSYLQKRKGVLDGVVISGGEPTLMPDLVDKIKAIKALGYEIKLDTNGTNPKMMKYLLENHLVDYVAMDIKNCFDKYDVTTGVTSLRLEGIKESISYLINSGYDYEFRTTLVDEFHNVEDIKKMANELKGAKKLYLQLFKDSGTCIKQGLHPVRKEKAEEFVNILKDHIDHVALRGYE